MIFNGKLCAKVNNGLAHPDEFYHPGELNQNKDLNG